MATINWDDMENAHQEAQKPAPAGRYIMQVKNATEGKSKEGQYPQIRIVWEVAEGPYKGKAAFDYLTFNPEKPASISMSRAVVLMLGFRDLKEWGEALQAGSALTRVIGKRIEADLIVDEYQGRVGNKIKQKIRALDGSSSVASGGLVPPPAADAPLVAPVNPLAGI